VEIFSSLSFPELICAGMDVFEAFASAKLHFE